MLCRGGGAAGASTERIRRHRGVDQPCLFSADGRAQLIGRSSFEIAISLQASASNNLEVAFGCDADSDGELSAEEQSLTVGWDSGSWFLRDDATGELTSVPRADGQRRLDFRVMIDSELRPCGLIARDGGVVFAYDARSMPSSAFDPDWNLVRVTARGFRNPMERLSVGFAPAGFSVHLK